MKKLILLAALLLSPLSMLSQNATIEHPWKGARVAFIGDSIITFFPQVAPIFVQIPHKKAPDASRTRGLRVHLITL